MIFSEMRGDIKEDSVGMLDNRGVGGSTFYMNQILETIKCMQMHQVASPSTIEYESDTSYLVISDKEKDA